MCLQRLGIYPDHRGTNPDATSPTSGGADSCRRIPAHSSCVVGKTPLAQWKNHRLWIIQKTNRNPSWKAQSIVSLQWKLQLIYGSGAITFHRVWVSGKNSVCLIKLKPGWCAPIRDSFYPVPCTPKSHLVKCSLTECCNIPSVFLSSQWGRKDSSFTLFISWSWVHMLGFAVGFRWILYQCCGFNCQASFHLGRLGYK